jgi:hypothetical protein
MVLLLLQMAKFTVLTELSLNLQSLLDSYYFYSGCLACCPVTPLISVVLDLVFCLNIHEIYTAGPEATNLCRKLILYGNF